ncbi:MAG: SIMPL domain-containing protein, partial [Sphaerochaetaceae bacterium]
MKRKTTVALVACIMLILAGCASTDQVRGTITVTGKGTVEVKPDMATFHVTVKETKDTTSEAQKATNEKISQVLGILSSRGVGADDIATESLDFFTEYEWA